MRAIYEVKFSSKETGAVVDTRRIVRQNSTRGFMDVAKWASEHCDKDESVTSITLMLTEQT